MDESSLHISHNLDNDLIRELVELREMRNDRENLLRANHYYASKLTSMELKISEYKALNETKDLEINKLKSRMRSLMHREIEIEKESTKASFT